MRPSINGFVNSALLIWSVGVTESPDIDDVRISRIDYDSADLAGILQAYVGPRRAAVTRFVNAIAGRQVGSNVGLASSGKDRLRVRWRQRDCPDRANRLAVKDWPPDSPGVRSFPDTAIDCAEIKGCGVARHACDRNHTTSTEWANESPFEAANKLRRHGLGNSGPRKQKNEERDETLMKARPKFVQVAIPHWVRSLVENKKLLVGF